MKTTLIDGIADLLKAQKFEPSEIVEAGRFLYEKARRLQGHANAIALDEFDRDDLVVLKKEHGSKRLPAGVVGSVKKKGFKNITVDFGPYRQWRIPASWLEAAPKGSKFAYTAPITRQSLLGKDADESNETKFEE